MSPLLKRFFLASKASLPAYFSYQTGGLSVVSRLLSRMPIARFRSKQGREYADGNWRCDAEGV
jgi:hypothetical protein